MYKRSFYFFFLFFFLLYFAFNEIVFPIVLSKRGTTERTVYVQNSPQTTDTIAQRKQSCHCPKDGSSGKASEKAIGQKDKTGANPLRGAHWRMNEQTTRINKHKQQQGAAEHGEEAQAEKAVTTTGSNVLTCVCMCVCVRADGSLSQPRTIFFSLRFFGFYYSVFS